MQSSGSRPTRQLSSLSTLRRASLLLCVLATVCFLGWAGWRVSTALAVDPRLSAALEDRVQRGQAGVQQHLQQASQILAGLMPRERLDALNPAPRWLQEPALFASMGIALTRITPDVQFVYFDNLAGAAHGVQYTADGFRFGARDPLQAAGLVFQSRRVGTSGPADTASEHWYDAAVNASTPVFSPPAWSKADNQLEVTLSQAVRDSTGVTTGIVGVDLGLKRLPALLSTWKASPRSLVYLVDDRGYMVASTYEESLVMVRGTNLQRRLARDSASAVIRASDKAISSLQKSDTTRADNVSESSIVLRAPDLPSGDVVALRKKIELPGGTSWQLVVLAPERDFADTLGSPNDWLGVSLAVLAALSLAIAALLWQIEHYFARARRALEQDDIEALAAVTSHTQIQELQQFSDALHHARVELSEQSLSPLVGYGAEHAPSPPPLESAVVAALRADVAEASQRALTAARSRAAFLAVISHEFRTPLNGATGMSALLSETSLTAEQRSYLDALTASSRHLQSVLDEIVDYCRVESDDVTLQMAPFNVRDVVDQACDDAAQAALIKGLELSVDVPGTVRDAAGALRQWVVDGDAARVSKVVSTLAMNAVKFTDSGGVKIMAGQIWPHGRDGVPALEVRVVDSGPGIPTDQVRYIFKPFTQLDSSISRKHGGTGLGLAICHRLANLMGGTIEVDSELERGSVFCFVTPAPLVDAETAPGRLTPAVAADDTLDAHHADAQASITLQPLRNQRSEITVLVVDDNDINLKVACAILKKFGYTVKTASGGLDAIDMVTRALAEGERIDVVLMDVHMPDIDGIQATETILALHGDAAPPIIALTADTSGHYVQRCLEAGMVDYLNKPLQAWALAQSLLRWVGVGQIGGTATSAGVSISGALEDHVNNRAAEGMPKAAARASLAMSEDDLSMPQGLVDLDRLNDFREFDDSKFTITHEVINLLFKEVPIKLAALEQAVANDDVAALASAAHSLRGVAGHVGAVVVEHLCSLLERSAIAEGRVPSDAGACLVALRSAWNRTRPLLEDWQ